VNLSRFFIDRPIFAGVLSVLIFLAGVIAIRVVMRGTHLGELFGIAPTGKKVEVDQINIERIQNSRIVEHWRVTDELAQQRQLGLIRT
jgi:predicted ester cyclase